MIYILWMKEFYDEPAYIVNVFTSVEKLVAYRDKMIEKHHGLYQEDDFDIDIWETDPDMF